ncbi:UvrD-helicase domain-containing protein [Novilysobacter defluvii]|uniref:UvrD-helicase domain-containing protein n=1 Tax=Novilysobacter defluvii TaxID=391738 RepID=UPI00041A947D|nr:UvrD-helicase domain-containing protein [Lysobacter defluvii]
MGVQGQGEQPGSSALRGAGTPWTEEQRRVIEAEAGARILVDAGPGTGKTATACARIAWLIETGGLDASEIWLISFTRTAVHELRSRVASYVKDPATIAALRIATIDSHAWAIHSGFDERASISGSFESNIARVIELVREHEGVFEYLSTVRNLVVDEAQDIVGSRSELLLEVIHALPEEAGVSVFSDDAQAIYGFAEPADGAVEGNLPEQIREFMADQFCEMDLSQVHRTQDATLLQVFAEGRLLIRGQGQKGAERLQAVKDLIGSSNHGRLGLYRDDLKSLPEDIEDAFLLFRTRGEALDASSWLAGRPHRLRMAGLPVCVHGWVSVLFWDWVEPYMEEAEFTKRWASRTPTSSVNAESAWKLLLGSFGRNDGRLSIVKMATRLASASPPLELSTPEFGATGPVVGTIHGSKGREANEVRLYLADSAFPNGDESSLDEEARVVFVGATRARGRLHVGGAASKVSSKTLKPSGRAYTPYHWANGKPCARARVEVGRARDIDSAGLVGIRLFHSRADAEAAQARVMSLGSQMWQGYASSTSEATEWRYQVCLNDSSDRLCYLSSTLNHDMFAIAKTVEEKVRLGRTRPPSQLRYMTIFGFRTIALAPDDPARELLHSPWRESGFLAAPMLLAYPFAYFR